MTGSVARSVSRPFVGRHAERRLLRHLLDEAFDSASGRPGLVVVSGVPGAGKTALLGWLAGAATEAPATGVTVLRTAGGAPALPLAAVRRLVASLPELAGARDRWLATLDDDGGPGVDATEPPLAEVRVELAAAEVTAALVSRARRRPLLVLVDDADELEPLSARVLEQVVQGLDDAGLAHGGGQAGARGGGQGLQVLVALASGPAPDPEGFVARALRLASARPVALGGLDDHDVFEMLAALGPHPMSRPTPTQVDDVIRASGGLPLLVETELDQQTVTTATGVRVRSIADAMRVRLDKVDGPTRQLLTRAALLGEPWDLDELAAAAAAPVADVTARIDDASAAGLVERDGSDERGGLRFCHPLVRAELAASLRPAPRAALHREIADRLAGPDDDRLLVRAHHLLQAHESAGTPAAGIPELVATLRAAGQVALRWGAWHDASRFLSAALVLDDTVDDSGHAGERAGDRARHHLEAGLAAWFDHDATRCEAELRAALDLAAKSGDHELRLRAATRLVIARVGAQPLRFGRRPAVGELEDALDEAATGGVDPVQVVEGRAVLADALYASGEADRALALVAMARDAMGSGAQPGAAALARLEMAEGLHRMAGLELAAAAGCFDAGVARARAAGDPLAVLTLRARRALVALQAGAVDGARDELQQIEDEALHQRFWGEAGFAAAVRAVALALAGDPAAPAVAERARHLARRSGHAYTAAVVAPVLAALDARRYGLDVTLATPAAGVATADVGLRTSSAVGVLCAVEANDAAAARAGWAAARWHRGWSGPPTLVGLPVLAALVEAGDLLGESSAVVGARPALVAADERGVEVVLGWPVTVARLRAVAARHAGDAADARFQVERALRLTERRHLPVERAKVLVELARLEHRDRADRDAAGALLVEAAETFDAASMLGWVGRCEDVASRELGVTTTLPSRVVDDRTILTDDVVGSTAANARLGDLLYLESLRVHDRIVRARLREHGGEEIKHTGDGLNAIFRDPADAVRCALAVQADIAEWRRAEPDLALEVRCGLARGSLVPSGGDYFGLVQSAAARLCGLAAPGEVLVTGPVGEGLAGAGMVVEQRGAHRLKGLTDPVEVLRVSGDRL